jgi:hypothetical protein
MKIALTNLSDGLYADSRLLLNRSAKAFGINDIFSFDFDDIKASDFYRANEEILTSAKGLGYWLWKPYIILEAMKQMSDGDIVIYSDCGIEIIASLHPLIKLCSDKEPILVFGNANHVNASWTKRDCFILMECDSERYWFGPHCDAGFALFQKTDFTLRFLNEWLHFGQNKHVITDLPNACGKDNLAGFVEHRRDQSILSLLTRKYEIALYRMPTQFGNHYKMHAYRVCDEFNCINQADYTQVNFYHFLPYYNSPYGQLLFHHRKKNHLQNEKLNISDHGSKQNDEMHIVNKMKTLSAKVVRKFYDKL